MARGQASIEILASVCLILLLCLLVFWFAMLKQQDIDYLEESYNNQRICTRLSFVLSSVYSAKTRAELVTSVEEDIKIVGNRIHLENYSCTFVGDAEDADIAAGRIRVSNYGGAVVVENI